MVWAIAALLSGAPGLKLLVTSRNLLHLAGERLFPVPPLPVPDRRDAKEPDELAQYASVRLFVERAQWRARGFALSASNAAAIGELCAHLDGLPLAIELAAARLSLLSPEAMLERIDKRFKLLSGGARDLPERHQALRNTLQWSYDLLTGAERALFIRLAIFAGSFSLAAAEQVAEADIETLGSLVDHNLVRRQGDRFAMLETIREFAHERLLEDGGAEALRDRHALYFEALAERAHAGRPQRDQQGLEALEADHDNLLRALDRLQGTDARRALRLAGALGWFWHLHSHFRLGRARLSAALEGCPARDGYRARTLAAAGEIAAWSGDAARARQLIEEAVAIWRAEGRSREIACALIELGWGCFFAGDTLASRDLMEEGLALQESVGDPLLVNRARVGLLQVLVALGELTRVEGMAAEALALAERSGDGRSAHFVHHFLADCALIRGDCALAGARYRKSLELAVSVGDRAETGFEVQGVAMAAAGNAEPVLALRLAGAAAAEFEALAVDYSGVTFWVGLLDRYLIPARTQLGPEAASAAWEEGQRTRFEDAVALALAIEA
jgi:predicted ATPase